MELTNDLRRRFCKECGIPINIFEEPYFSERVNLYDRIMGTKIKWMTFLESLSRYDTEQDFYEDYNKTKELVIDYLQNNHGFETFCQEDMNRFKVKNNTYISRDVYKEPNNGLWFFSIDMVKANYTALRFYDPSIFNHTNTWEAFLSQFTDNQHFIESKYMRQVIMGALSPGRQTAYEKYLMDQLVTKLIEAGYGGQIECFTNDEIVIRIDSVSDPDSIRKLIVPFVVSGIALRGTLFRLEKNITLSGYTLNIYGALDEDLFHGNTKRCADLIKFKGLTAMDYPYRLRNLYGEELTENDQVFSFNGRLVKYIN